MARPVQFDRNQVLRDAMIVFWRQGYNATTLKDLTAVTHLQPGSLYGAFHNKRTLFKEALNSYFKELEEFATNILLSPKEAPFTRIKRFYEELIQRSAQDPDRKGCLLVNTLIETPIEDSEINHRVTQMLQVIENAIHITLKEAAENGELSPQKQPAALAKMLITGVFGMLVYNKTQPGDIELQQIINGFLSVLE